MGSNQSCEDIEISQDIYSLGFLKALYDSPKDNLNKIVEATLISNTHEQDQTDEDNNCNVSEKRILLNFFKKIVDMKSRPAKQWTDLQHYLYFVYRYCRTSDPDPQQETLSPYFIADMRSIVFSLMAEDEVQLCLRLFSLVREYTIFAHKQHQKITNIETSIESLFYYYEAFLSATKNICKIFPELEKLLLNTYKLGWLDFNTSIFMYYFYETPYVQNIVREFQLMKEHVSIKAAGIYTVLTELHKLWRSQMLGINGVIASKLGAKFKGLDNEMMTAHKRILSKNFWVDRTPEEKSIQDMQLFDYQLFTLVGNKSLVLPDATLDDLGQCICEDCLIIKYKALLDNSHCKLVPDSTKVSCRFCKQQVDLDHFQQHISELEGNNCKNLSKIISDNIDIVKLGMSTNSKSHKKKSTPPIESPRNSQKRQINEPSPKIAQEPPGFKSDPQEDDHIDITKLAFPDLDGSKVSRKTFYNFLKYRNSLPRSDKENICEQASKTPEKPLPTLMKQSPQKSNEVKVNDVAKGSKGTNTTVKNAGINFPCGHDCKLEDDFKSEFKKTYQEGSDHHKESKKCDCTFCEVFGTTSSHVHKTNETRNRLRIRLNQRNEKVNAKVAAKANCKVNSQVKVCPSKSDPAVLRPLKDNHSISVNTPLHNGDVRDPLMNDIHGLLNYIEGNTNVDKMALAEKKAAKKARQRNKKEQERLRIEEEERQRVEEEKRKAEEKIRNEELAKQLAEKAKKSKKENKKQRQKNKKESNAELVEETIPAMVTIKRVVESHNSLPTVTITLKGSTPDQDKLLYTLVNGSEGNEVQSSENKKNKKNKNQQNETNGKVVNLEVNTNNKNKKNKNDKTRQQNNTVITKELRVTLAVDPLNSAITENKKNNKQNTNKQFDAGNKTANNLKKVETKKKIKEADSGIDFDIPMLRLPPGITITKVDGPMTDRNYKASSIDNPPYNSNIPVSKSGVIVVDTEKLIKQSSVSSSSSNGAVTSKKSRKKRNKKQTELQNNQANQNSKPSMVTLKNPIFQNMQNTRHESELIPDLGGGQCQQAAIFKNENGMVTIRSSRLQQSLTNGSPVPNLLSDLKPVLGPEVPTTYMSSCNFSESTRISSFNAQEILSGLPGIEITKVDKHSTKNELDNKKSCHTAEVSIIPASNSDKFHFDKDDLHYDNVFTPKDILEDDMDADERELEAFKRFCQQSVPPERKEKVAHLNVKDIVLKKKNDKISA